MFLIASFLLSWLIGLAITAVLVPRGFGCWNGLFRTALAWGLGIGVTSSLLFLWLLLHGSFHYGFFFLELGCLLSTLIFLLLRSLRNLSRPSAAVPHESDAKIEKRFRLGFFLLLMIGTGILILVSLLAPHGDWDAWAIWNNRARFIFRSGRLWRDAFSPLIHWSHPDYPLLLPLTESRCWFYLGRESLAVPAFVAIGFSLSIIAFLVSALGVIKNKTQGYLGGILLLSAPSFLTHGASQYADIPLAFFILAAIVTLYGYDHFPVKDQSWLVLGGLLAGFSAWTKNEGLLFVFILLLLRFGKVFSRPLSGRRWAETVLFLSGLVPPLFLLFLFKTILAPRNDLLSLMTWDLVKSHLNDPGRYLLIGKTFFTTLFFFGDGPLPLLPFLLIYALWVGRSSSLSGPWPFAPLSLQLLGYLLVFLLTPQDLRWHLGTSLGRLMLHLWPAFLWVLLAQMKTPEEAWKRKNPSPIALPCFDKSNESGLPLLKASLISPEKSPNGIASIPLNLLKMARSSGRLFPWPSKNAGKVASRFPFYLCGLFSHGSITSAKVVSVGKLD
jgi:hypothetical protein